jgi:hypothetical protein
MQIILGVNNTFEDFVLYRKELAKVQVSQSPEP